MFNVFFFFFFFCPQAKYTQFTAEKNETIIEHIHLKEAEITEACVQDQGKNYKKCSVQSLSHKH